VSDLRGLAWRNVWEEGTTNLCSHINIIEQKTGKRRRIIMSVNISEALTYLLAHLGRTPEPDEAIFRNRITRKVYSREHLSRVVGLEARRVGISDPIGCHSLRKTWAYHASQSFGQSITVIQAAFGHSSQQQTMSYIGLTDDDIDEVIEAVAL